MTHADSLKIVKIGSSILSDPEVLKEFLNDFSRLSGKKILVHGGGRHATELAKKLDVKVKMIDGRRITCKDTLDIITMSYAGKINKNIVAQLQALNCNAIGLSGADGNLIRARKRPVKQINYGFVGDIVQVNQELLTKFLRMDISPVICAVTHDGKGTLLNTNADTIASELALGMARLYETELFYCSEKPGVLKNLDDHSSVIKVINQDIYSELMNNSLISDGMIPKLDNCMYAIQNNVKKVYIGDQNVFKAENKNFTIIQQ